MSAKGCRRFSSEPAARFFYSAKERASGGRGLSLLRTLQLGRSADPGQGCDRLSQDRGDGVGYERGRGSLQGYDPSG